MKYCQLFAVLISVETSFAILCSSKRPPCPEGFFCFNITCSGMDIGRCTDIDECVSNPCQNGGTCHNSVGNYTCTCPVLWEGYNCDVEIVGTDCLDLLNAGITTSGIYPITLWSTNTKIDVYCDMQTDGGGWTVFQNRLNGGLDFNRVFSEFENGFGDVSHEFWLGLKHVQEIAAQGQTKLRIHLIDVDDNFFYREYMDFSLTTSLYVLNIGAESGSPLVYTWANLDDNNGMPFTTVDSDNDLWSSNNCAVITQSGWWHRKCFLVNLNGQYATPGVETQVAGGWTLGIIHFGIAQNVAFKTSSMMIRRD